MTARALPHWQAERAANAIKLANRAAEYAEELRKGRPGDDAFRELCVAALRVVDDGDFLTALENHCAEHGIDRDGYPIDSDTGERIGLPVGPNWPMIREQLT